MGTDGMMRIERATPASPSIDRRRSWRRALTDTFVVVETPVLAPELCWACSALDISYDGMGLVLLSEVTPGEEVLVSFRLDDARAVVRASSIVLRQEGVLGLGAIRFAMWADSDRLTLASYLVERGSC